MLQLLGGVATISNGWWFFYVMTLIRCSNCGKRISSLAKSCSHCGLSPDLIDKTSQWRSLELRRRAFRNQLYRLKMLGYLAMVLAVCGAIPILFDYLEALGLGRAGLIKQHWGMRLIVLGGVIYLLLRVRVMQVKLKYLKLKRSLQNDEILNDDL